MPAVARKCAQCSAELPAKDPRKLFCSRPCKAAFHNLDLSRAAGALVSLLQVWRGSRLKGGNAALGKYAFREACALIDRMNAEDRASGRDPAFLIQGKHAAGWRACDAEPRQKAAAQPWEG
jgi:hypothetical protein